MARFITLDNNSGFIFGDVTAPDAVQACIATDKQADATRAPRAYTGPLPRPFSTVTGYYVYRVEADFPEVDDGQSQDLIDRLEADGEMVGFYEVRETEDCI